MRVLVLGGSYFIGRVLVEKLVSHDAVQTTILNRGTRQNLTLKNVECLTADRRDSKSMQRQLSNRCFDVVFDLSAYDEESVRISYPLLRNTTKRYVFLSSIAACRQSPRCWPISELHEVCQLMKDGQYGYEKVQAEKFLLGNSRAQVPVTVVRPTYVYGQYDYSRRLLYLFERLENNLPILISGSGDNLIQFGHVVDLADALFVLATHEKAADQIFNVSGSEIVTVKQLIDTVADCLRKEAKIVYTQQVPATEEISTLPSSHRFADISKVKKFAGISPKISLTEGLKRTVDWWKEKKDARYLSCSK